MNYENPLEVVPGMWVRFQRNGALVIAEVAYVRPSSTGHLYAHTIEHGEVPCRAILEARSTTEPPR